jgi:hypothetical protein
MEVSPRTEPRRMTVAEAAKYFGRSQRTIRLWCLNGTLIAFNYSVIRTISGYSIVIPE